MKIIKIKNMKQIIVHKTIYSQQHNLHRDHYETFKDKV